MSMDTSETMAGDTNQDLRILLAEVRALLAREGNRFEWSGWQDSVDALGEFDALVAATLEQNDLASRRDLGFYFAATGPIQEVSIDSGWGDEFLALASRIDKLL